MFFYITTVPLNDEINTKIRVRRLQLNDSPPVQQGHQRTLSTMEEIRNIRLASESVQ